MIKYLEAKSCIQSFFLLMGCLLGENLNSRELSKRNIILVSWCCLCKENGVTFDYLLLHCPFLKEIWDLVFALFGLQWLMPRKVIDLLACWQGYIGWDWHRAIWRRIPHCFTWCVWRERNNRSLEGCEWSVSNQKQLFLKTLFEWVSTSRCFSCSNFFRISWSLFFLGVIGDVRHV